MRANSRVKEETGIRKLSVNMLLAASCHALNFPHSVQSSHSRFVQSCIVKLHLTVTNPSK